MIAFRLKPGHVAPLASLVRAVATTGDVERAPLGLATATMVAHGGPFSTSYLGLATGLVGIASLPRFGVTMVVNAVLATAWIFLIGYRLFRLGQE